MTSRLHDFNMEDGMRMTKHLDKLDEVFVRLQSLDEPIDKARQHVILLSSLTASYEIIASIEEKVRDVTPIEVKEKLFKEYERQDNQKSTERKLKATTHGVSRNTHVSTRTAGSTDARTPHEK